MSKVLLIIIDGFGISNEKEGNATLNSSFIWDLMKKECSVELHASGKWVGVKEGQAGNSEVGHLTIGCGRINKQSVLRVEELYESKELEKLIKGLPKLTKRVHFIGLLSDGCVHSDINQLKRLISVLPENHDVFVHAIADGIDTPPKKFGYFLNQVSNVVSVCGRYYAMDRDKNWDRTEKYFDEITNGTASTFDLEQLYSEGLSDEFILPVLIKQENIKKEDTVILFNFRADRMKQLYSKFKEYCTVYTLTEYELGDPNSIVKTQKLDNILSEVLARNGKKQAHIAETEKYAHVTYFLNGGREIKSNNEDWVVVPSPKVDSFKKSPGTSMREVMIKVAEYLEKNYDFIVANLAAPDLLGHTGDFVKASEACALVDKEIENIYNVCYNKGYVLLITADHGNAECMLKDGTICKSHTANKVPFIIANYKKSVVKSEEFSLRDVAPTILDILEIEKPSDMTGSSIFKV